MKPSLELDVRIAEEVMDHKIVTTTTGRKVPRTLFTIGDPIWHDYQGDMRLQNGIPRYSTSISQAWKIIKKLNLLEFEVQREHYTSTIYTAICYNDPDLKDRQIAFAKTAPLAICLVALKYVESIKK